MSQNYERFVKNKKIPWRSSLKTLLIECIHIIKFSETNFCSIFVEQWQSCY